ncbi:MAG: PD40 domain-containing protein [Kiritimatiellae bacterium]|nr:PD40 domain-containing protein [Kiritimatiellia bacterium]
MRMLFALLAAVMSAAVALGERGGQLPLRETRICRGESAAVSPDGGSIAFMRLEGHRFCVLVRDLRTGSETAVPSGPGQAIMPRWRKDGAIVFTAANETKSAFAARNDQTGWNLHLFRDGQIEKLTSGRIRETCASFAPDGSLYFVADVTDGKDIPSIVRIGVDGRRETAVTLPETPCMFGDPSVSPDGRLLLRAEAEQYNQPWRIVVSPVTNCAGRTYLTPKTMPAYAPTWSPGGKYIAFTGCQEGDGGWHVYLMPANGGSMKRLAKGRNPSFAPDCRAVFYDRDSEIFMSLLDSAFGEHALPEAEDAPEKRLGDVEIIQKNPQPSKTPKLPAAKATTFEKIAFVDGSDYPHVFDIENAAGTERIVDRVLETGADVILWRTHSGAMPRYVSAQEDLDRMVWPVDKRRSSRSTEVNGWVTLWGNNPDQLQVVSDVCSKRPQVRKWGLHMLLEEAHWQFMYLGAWNLEHPQFWCRKRDGTVQMYHGSFAYPEVLKHRLSIVKELIGYGPDMIYVDTCRNGGYFLANEYVKPYLDRWAKLYPGESVPSDSSDPRWVAIASEGRYNYFKGIRRLIDASGRRIPLLVGVDSVNGTDTDRTTTSVGVDWRRYVNEGIVDGVVVASIAVDPVDALGSMERYFRRVMDFVNGRCNVYFPIMAYNFSKQRPGYGQISKWAGVSVAEGLRLQMEIAVRCGAAGIVMECVDPDNYPECDQKVIRDFVATANGERK